MTEKNGAQPVEANFFHLATLLEAELKSNGLRDYVTGLQNEANTFVNHLTMLKDMARKEKTNWSDHRYISDGKNTVVIMRDFSREGKCKSVYLWVVEGTVDSVKHSWAPRVTDGFKLDINSVGEMSVKRFDKPKSVTSNSLYYYSDSLNLANPDVTDFEKADFARPFAHIFDAVESFESFSELNDFQNQRRISGE